MERRFKSMVVMLAMLAMLGAAVRPAMAEENFAKDFGIGIGTIFTNLIYMPAKFVYTTLGGITGSFAFCLTGGRMDTANAIWRPSLGGTYVVTPSMLRGEDPIYFSGVTRRASDDEERRDTGTPREGY